MDIIKFINSNVDPFIMQLLIVPFISIGLGVFVSRKTRVVFLAPLITFVLSFIYTKFFLGLPWEKILRFEWGFIFSTLSLIIALIFKFKSKKY
ncbi:hypothetical protein [Clostridium sp. CCUG 7971]|uniref:hypothetical protein n=1 Tax=Clostridium sp. CCUG 7971 TaxID=2811414 RepID=UPI001ABAEDF0|nr:hypothetical protein [Clostridium sp. CCUG 7971]MBO3443713.1 hypothetical protein [Clostridium sp. CCUG 7971]